MHSHRNTPVCCNELTCNPEKFAIQTPASHKSKTQQLLKDFAVETGLPPIDSGLPVQIL